MRALLGALLILLLLPPAEAQVGLISGVGRRFSIAPQSQPFFLTGITIGVPPGTTRLTIDLDLYARFDRAVQIVGGIVAADFFAHTVGTGREQIIITPGSTPPLQAGTYHLAIAVVTLNTAIAGSGLQSESARQRHPARRHSDRLPHRAGILRAAGPHWPGRARQSPGAGHRHGLGDHRRRPRHGPVPGPDARAGRSRPSQHPGVRQHPHGRAAPPAHRRRRGGQHRGCLDPLTSRRLL